MINLKQKYPYFNKNILLIVILVLSINIIKANVFDENEISLGFFGKINKPDRDYNLRNANISNTTLVEEVKAYTSFGFTLGKANSLYGFKFDYGKFLEGTRGTASIHVNHRGIISPYFGASFVSDTKRIIIVKRREQELDGYDALLGVSVGAFNILKAFAEYNVYNNMWFVGISLHIPIKFSFTENNKHYKIDFGD